MKLIQAVEQLGGTIFLKKDTFIKIHTGISQYCRAMKNTMYACARGRKQNGRCGEIRWDVVVVVVSHIQRIGCQPEKNYFTRWPIPLVVC